MSALDYLPSSPTLFNSGHAPTRRCPRATCSTRPGTISSRSTSATARSPSSPSSPAASASPSTGSRSQGSLIRGTNGLSNGIVPWLKTLDASVAAVNQGGRRKGAACVYLESWHADIEEFLELRDNTGDEARRRAHHQPRQLGPRPVHGAGRARLGLVAVRPEDGARAVRPLRRGVPARPTWTPRSGPFERQVPARQLYARMMRTLAETGNGWMTFKDAANGRCNQTGRPGAVVHLSNLCTEIIEVSARRRDGRVQPGLDQPGPAGRGRRRFNFERLGEIVRIAVTVPRPGHRHNYYPTPDRGLQRPLAPGRPRA